MNASYSPWWLTALLPIVTAVLTHFAALWREREKGNELWRDEWKKRIIEQTRQIVDLATKHFTEKDSLANTESSASSIVSSLKRLGQLLEEVTFMVSAEQLRASRELSLLQGIITDDAEFTSKKRKLLSAADNLIQRIQEGERHFIGSCNVDLKRRKKI